MVLRAWRSVALLFLVSILAASCVVLDLFPSAEDGAGGAGAGTGPGATDASSSSAPPNASSSSSSSGAVVTVDWIEGLKTGGSPLQSARLLDLTTTPDGELIVAGYTVATGGIDLDLGPSCVEPTGAAPTFFAAGFEPFSGECLWLEMVTDQSVPAIEPHASVAVYQDRVYVAISDRINGASTIRRFSVGGSLEGALPEAYGLVISDIAATPIGLAVGGYVTEHVSYCGWTPAGSGQTDAFFARVTGPDCAMIDRVDLGHDPIDGSEEVASVAYDDGTEAITVLTDHALTVGMYGVYVAAGAGNTFFQDLATHDVRASGDVTCLDMTTVAPPRVAMAAGVRWVFGPNCDPKLMFLHDNGTEAWQLVDSFPQPGLFDEPVTAAAVDRLVFGGEYRGGTGAWAAQWTTGVIGSFDTGGSLRYLLDVQGEAVDHDTEVTGIAVSADGETVWAIGNYASNGFTLAGSSFLSELEYACDPTVPCKPFIARLSVADP